MKECNVLLSPKNSVDMMGTLYEKGDIIQGTMVEQDNNKYIEIIQDGILHTFDINIIRQAFYIERGSIKHE